MRYSTKKIKRPLVMTLMAMTLIFGSCMQWDKTEDNENLFGSWHLESILIDGEPESDYAEDPNLMISFQGKIFNFGYLGGYEIYGSWSYAGEVLTLIAGYNAGSGADREDLFNPFPLPLHFPADVEEVEITVTKSEKRVMQWQYIDQNGSLLTYNFRKYP